MKTFIIATQSHIHVLFSFIKSINVLYFVEGYAMHKTLINQIIF